MEPPKGSLHYLENFGRIGLAADRETHDLILMLNTDIGAVSEPISKERALQIGIALVRYSGQRFRFAPEKPTVVGPPPESRQEKRDDSDSSGNGDVPGDGPGMGPDTSAANDPAGG
jgi:hypothetical protein